MAKIISVFYNTILSRSWTCSFTVGVAKETIISYIEVIEAIAL